MKTELLITIKQRFIPFNLFLFFLRIRLASLWLANLMITFLGAFTFLGACHCFLTSDNTQCLKGQLTRPTYQKF